MCLERSYQVEDLVFSGLPGQDFDLAHSTGVPAQLHRTHLQRIQVSPQCTKLRSTGESKIRIESLATPFVTSVCPPQLSHVVLSLFIPSPREDDPRATFALDPPALWRLTRLFHFPTGNAGQQCRCVQVNSTIPIAPTRSDPSIL